MPKKLSDVREEVEQNVFHQYDTLITAWLHEQPSDELDEYWLQLEKAKWREERYFKMMQMCFWGQGEN